MKEKILVKKSNCDIKKELKSINFSAEYSAAAEKKFNILNLKIFDLKPAEANILKQTCLSLGFDAAVNRDAVTCKCDKSDVLISGSLYQITNLCKKLEQQPFRLKQLALQMKEIISAKKYYKIGNQKFDFQKTYLMGIINVTPDSFSDGGKNFNPQTAVKNALKMYRQGAKIIDIGGESTRPDAVPVTWETECQRIIPVIKEIKKQNPKIIISIDTIHPKTVEPSIKAGADILNTVEDISKFEDVFDLLKFYKTPIVITHSNGIPPKPQETDFDGDIADFIFKYFAEKIEYLKSKGLKDNLFILDVGIGFGKSINDQFELIKRADEFFTLGYPVLYGISRKSFISKTFGISKRDEVTQIYSQHLINKKVNLLRVHDVEVHKNLQKYLSKIS